MPATRASLPIDDKRLGRALIAVIPQLVTRATAFPDLAEEGRRTGASSPEEFKPDKRPRAAKAAGERYMCVERSKYLKYRYLWLV
ncbi:hypothetical protein CKAH01_09114 [Colletotrichum kahawae]|uniref:Uncharacterized protein n=1 Tax=Colletotrichum kahawae TaxID=34407 RepID=A0AAD9Y144_COLKA|nr:hypothetical protein CKAH01_09114 [Colletotrichum kahawae]